MIYNKFLNKSEYKKICLQVNKSNYLFIKNQAKNHDISVNFLLDKIINKYVKNCKQNMEKF